MIYTLQDIKGCDSNLR